MKTIALSSIYKGSTLLGTPDEMKIDREIFACHARSNKVGDKVVKKFSQKSAAPSALVSRQELFSGSHKHEHRRCATVGVPVLRTSELYSFSPPPLRAGLFTAGPSALVNGTRASVPVKCPNSRALRASRSTCTGRTILLGRRTVQLFGTRLVANRASP
jgi:hypothetical protein